MHRKRSLIRVLARLMYASGLIFVISGLLLSAAYSPAAAARDTQSRENFSSQPLQETMDPNCPCDTPTGPAPTSDNPTSSLAFQSGCHCSCEAVFATVCNLGGADMTSSVAWQLYYSASGNPSFGQVVDSGSLGPLGVNQCVNLNYPPNSAGLYAYRIEQEEGGSGPAVLWSNSCAVSGACFAPTVTSTPFLPDTATPTATAIEEPTATPTGTAPAVEITLTPTETATSEPTSTAVSPPAKMDFNLSFVCGYAGDDYLLWWVSNTTSRDVDYTWRVSGSDEQGSGSVEAESVGYFTTSVGDKTVRLFVDGELVDSAVSSEPCKQYLTLSYTCTEDGSLVWVARNPNDFGVDYTWTIDGEAGGRGMLPANSIVELATTTSEVHTIELVWTDTRPGPHTVRLTSSGEPCDVPPTATPTNTLPAPPVEITLTPTPTNTLPPPTNTPTSTPTNTPTNTQPPPVVVVTNTPTNTQPPPVVVTATAQPPIVITATNSPTRPVVVVTNTPTNTQPPPVVVTNTALPPIIITATSAPTNTAQPPVVVVTNTPTNTAQPPVVVVTNTPTFTLQPPAIIIVTATNSPTVPVVLITPVSTDAAAPPFVASPTLITPQPQQVATATATQIVTLAPPVPTTTRTPVLIPVTGGDSTNYGLAVRMSLLGGLLTNTGLFVLGLALALTGIQTQLKQR